MLIRKKSFLSRFSRRICFNNSEGNGGGGSGDGAPPPATPAPPAASEPAAPSKGDWAGMATTLRAALGEIQALKAELKQQAPKPAAPAPAKAEAAPTDVEAVKATFNKQLELRDALADAGITDAKQRKAVQKLFDAEGPTDVGTWVNETLDLLGLKRAAAAAAQAAKPTPATPTGASSNQGAPVAENRPEIAANPFQWSQEYAEKVGADEFFRSWKKYVASQGGAHPFAAFHERHQPGSGGSVDALAEKLAERLKTR